MNDDDIHYPKIVTTDEQLTSYVKLMTRYKRIPRRTFTWDGVLFCDFGDITIGIEKDGYAHS
jgi:hypothetical protein